MTTETTEPTSARELFRAAYENRYTWDQDFPGYRADIEVKQGDEVYRGQVQINANYSVEVSGFEDEKVQESVYTQLRDIVTHRKRNVFDVAHGKNSFNLGETDNTGAVEILVSGDAMGSNYKVRGKEISMVSRVMGPMAFVINHLASQDTGEGYISKEYTAVFRNPKTHDIVRQMKFEEAYEKVGEYYLMKQQIINVNEKGNQSTTEFNFSNLQLL
ncbi:DUF3386 domain-containing protein [Leptolyngbya sp. FACHB-261]|nr:DUF3386 domain-containing protein [Leptolyngbya sp. FACHB-261]